MVGYTTTTSFELTSTAGNFSVRSVGSRGQQSMASGVTLLSVPGYSIGIKLRNNCIEFGEDVVVTLYSIDGKPILSSQQWVSHILTHAIPNGNYLIKITTKNGITDLQKLIIAHNSSI